MNKYHINRNRGPLEPGDVQKGQDFDSFLQAFKTRPVPFTKTTAFYASVAATGIVVAVGAYVLFSAVSETGKTTPYINPPLAHAEIADTAFTLDAASGGNFIFNTGSYIGVPEGAFLDEAGNAVTGNVQLHYREFHDPASIFLAGIPMTYDSAGIRYHFESAGMLDIYATQNGKQLKINPSQPIHVALASNTPSDKFNVYYLDTTKKNWQFVAKDKAVSVGFERDTAKKDNIINAQTASLPQPVLPRIANKERPGFAIDFDPSEFPELMAYRDVRFEVDENKTPYDKKDKMITWEDVSIKRNKSDMTYTVTFMKGETEAKYVTYIVVDAKNYPEAIRTYELRYKEYLQALEKRHSDLMKKHRDAETKLLNADARRIFTNDSALALALARRFTSSVNASKEDMVMREFVIRQFGIWNSDCPSSLPEGAEMFVKLIDSRSKKEMTVAHAYLVEKGRNAIFTYYNNDLAAFKFNPASENVLWVVTADGRLAVFDAENFSRLDPAKKKADLVMEVQEGKLESAEQARSVLGI